MAILNKYGVLILLILLLITNINMCGNATNKVLKKRMDTMSKKIDSLNSSLNKEIKLEGLRTAKRVLYDNNAIIRTVTRPDDRMNDYDKEIKSLEGVK